MPTIHNYANQIGRLHEETTDFRPIPTDIAMADAAALLSWMYYSIPPQIFDAVAITLGLDPDDFAYTIKNL